MRYIVTFSGGKDSLGTIVWAMNNLEFDDWDILFCDTDWEDELTYQHIDLIESMVGKKIIRVKHYPYPLTDEERNSIRKIFGKDNVFAEMILHKGRFPSTKARFCTEELKSKPMIDYILSCNYDVTVIQGVRADESRSRANLNKNDEYFKFYFEPYKINKKGVKLYHSYRKKEIITRQELFITDVLRPILHNTAHEVFDMIYSNGFKPNPLYKMGMGRVGCFPCVMCQKGEIKQINIVRNKRIEQLEQLSNSTFFSPSYIPSRFCTKTALVHLYLSDLIDTNSKLYNIKLHNQLVETESIIKYEDEEGDIYVIKRMKVPRIKDVITYVSDNPDQINLFEPIQSGCLSVYNICELGDK